MEYLRANPMKGISNDDTRIFQDIYAAHGSALHFTAIHIVDALVQKLAQKEGLEKEIIWNSLIHAQMSGLDLSNLKFQEQLDSGIGSKFTGELAHLTIEKIPPLLQKYNLEYRFKDFVQTLYDMKNRQDSLERNETTK
jgi:hypothetical protein